MEGRGMESAEGRKVVDRHCDEIKSALNSYGQIFKKQGTVEVRFAVDGDPSKQYSVLSEKVKEELRNLNFDPTSLDGKRGELVLTRLSDGELETPNVVPTGNPIVKNPGGEEYAPMMDDFNKKYEAKDGEPGVYIAKGYCIAVRNPFEKPIALNASWGEMQHGDTDCMIADSYEYATGKRGGDPYIIGRKEFQQTYTVA